MITQTLFALEAAYWLFLACEWPSRGTTRRSNCLSNFTMLSLHSTISAKISQPIRHLPEFAGKMVLDWVKEPPMESLHQIEWFNKFDSFSNPQKLIPKMIPEMTQEMIQKMIRQMIRQMNRTDTTEKRPLEPIWRCSRNVLGRKRTFAFGDSVWNSNF